MLKHLICYWSFIAVSSETSRCDPTSLLRFGYPPHKDFCAVEAETTHQTRQATGEAKHGGTFEGPFFRVGPPPPRVISQSDLMSMIPHVDDPKQRNALFARRSWRDALPRYDSTPLLRACVRRMQLYSLGPSINGMLAHVRFSSVRRSSCASFLRVTCFLTPHRQLTRHTTPGRRRSEEPFASTT